MSYSNDPELDAQRHCDSQHAYSQRVLAAEMAISTAFIKLAMRGDAGAVAEFAPTVLDFSQGVANVRKIPKRVPRLHECIREAIDILDNEQELMQLLLNAASGMDVRADATLLLSQCASKFAEANLGEIE
jgi:hypothetical protein